MPSLEAASGTNSSLAGDSLAVGGLTGFVVAQPLYDLWRDQSAFFVAHQADGLDVLGLVTILSLGVPLVAALVLAVARALGPGIGSATYRALIGLCGAAGGLLVARQLGLGTVTSLALGGVAGLLLGGFCKRPAWRTGLRWTAAPALLFPVLFLSHPSVRDVLVPEDPENAVETAGTLPFPVFLVLFDELPSVSLTTPEDVIDRGRFPNFHRLAATSTWYRKATTVAQSTIYAVPAILTGRYPQRRIAATPNINGHPTNLFTLLDAETPFNIWETSTRLCPLERCRPPAEWTLSRSERLPALLSDTAVLYLAAVGPGGELAERFAIGDQWRDFRGSREKADAAPRGPAKRTRSPELLYDWFLNRIASLGREPALHFAHVYIPHAPWTWLPDGRRFEGYTTYPHGLRYQRWIGSEWETTQAHQRHMLAVGFADTLLGRLLDRLDDLGIFDEAMIVVTSDHGTTFDTGQPRRNVRNDPFDALVGVPLFVKLPQQRDGAIDDRNAETVDILPTIMEAIGQPGSFDGVSLAGEPRSEDSIKRTFRSGNRGASAGVPLEYRTDEIVGRREGADAIARRFGSGDWESLYRAGPRDGLVGRRVRNLETTAPDRSARAELIGLERFHDVDDDSSKLPVHLYGSLGTIELPEAKRGVRPGSLAYRNLTPPAVIAIALDGRVATTTETFQTVDGRVDFTALIDPQRLGTGRVRVEIFKLTGEDPERWTPLPVVEAGFEP